MNKWVADWLFLCVVCCFKICVARECKFDRHKPMRRNSIWLERNSSVAGGKSMDGNGARHPERWRGGIFDWRGPLDFEKREFYCLWVNERSAIVNKGLQALPNALTRLSPVPHTEFHWHTRWHTQTIPKHSINTSEFHAKMRRGLRPDSWPWASTLHSLKLRRYTAQAHETTTELRNFSTKKS